MADLRKLLTRRQVRAALGVSDTWLYRQGRLHGFPGPVGGGRYFDPAAISAWLDRRAGLVTAAPVGADDPAFDWGAELDRRAEKLGAAVAAA